MSQLKSQVGPWKLKWKNVPRGTKGKAYVEIESQGLIEVSWRRDDHGIWISMPDGVFGFDLGGNWNDDGQYVYRVTRRNSDQEWNQVSCSYGESGAQTLARKNQSRSARVRAQMPGKMIRVLVQEGDEVEKDQRIAVMEAMKMENEIRSPQGGRVASVKVSEGQVVETGADLILIEVK